MSEHSPWLLGYWERTRIDHKDYYVFHEDPNDEVEGTGIYRGVKEGDQIHCSKFTKSHTSADPHLVLGLAGEYEYTFLHAEEKTLRRIVACVNFCAHIPTETIESLLEQKIGAATALKRQLVYCPSCGDAYDHETDDCLAKPLAEAAKEIE